MVCIFFFAIAGYLLFMEHRAHIGDKWIWLLLLACPLMHVFHHGGHSGHGGHGSHDHSDIEEEK
ncbi:MAG: DUF2933 domain-containing protein [Pseudomonadota bacterium]|nr:DUF2933 domain-containing protein [Pseudomonadota bacterium]QKK06511.1 MAG: DUF2933 domain-containing protein [Pseudomonadota bacterium]